MGVKRPLEENTFQELSFKQAKQLVGDNEPAEILECISLNDVSQKTHIPYTYDGKVSEPDFGGELEDNKADKELDTSATSSWITSCSSEEEGANGGACFFPLHSDFYDFNLPRRPPIQFRDAYSCLLDSYPRKEIPIGPGYQADIPEWHPDAFGKDSLGSAFTAECNIEQNWLGTSVIAMPDSVVSSPDDIKIGQGRMDCDCSDKGSIRCVRQHVLKAREQLRGSVGEEKFAGLGFLDMGEEVALKWTEEEERVFHEVVYSNPVTLGKNFWKHLSVAFPSRTKMEVVRYYFNAFTLQRRAVQNRCDYLDIDSDDDEWQGDGRFPTFGGDDDSVVDSFGDEDLEAGHEIDMSHEIDDENQGEDANCGYNCDNSGNDAGTCQHAALEKGDQEKQILKQQTEMSVGDSGYNSSSNNMEKHVNSNSRVAADRENVLSIERCSEGLSNENETSGVGFVLDPCDDKVWDDTFLTSHVRGIDFLPTSNMIEEIFGPCTWKNH